MTASIEFTNTELLAETNIDFNKMLHMDLDDLREYLVSHQMSDQHLDLLAKYSFQLGKLNAEDQNQYSSYNLLSKNLLLLAGEISKTTSFSRIALENQINEALNPNHGNT